METRLQMLRPHDDTRAGAEAGLSPPEQTRCDAMEEPAGLIWAHVGLFQPGRHAPFIRLMGAAS